MRLDWISHFKVKIKLKYKEKRIAVLGCGKSGIAASRLALSEGANVKLFDTGYSDQLQESVLALNAEGISVALGQEGICKDPASYDFVIMSPGISLEWEIVQPFIKSGINILGEIEFAFGLCDSEIIGVTGTNGKTTTVEIIGKILEECGEKVAIGGNHGRPFADIINDNISYSTIVLEVSSFQLETIKNFSPHIAVWTNFAPDHLDRYRSLEDYRNAKMQIFINQGDEDWAIVNGIDKPKNLKAKTVTFSAYNEFNDYYLSGSKIISDGEVIVDQSMTKLRGLHNAENLMVATAVAKIRGYENKQILNAALDYKVPPHRCELIAESQGVQFINDSKATNIHAMVSAINSFKGHDIVLVAGGKDKGISYVEASETVSKNVNSVVLFGENKFQISEDWKALSKCHLVEDLNEALRVALDLVDESGVVLFSPGTSSFDMFEGYEDRGNAFKNSVIKLIT